MTQNIRPLNEAACSKLGHIAYIRDDEPRDALRALFRAVAQEPCNAALWARPAAALDDTTLAHLRAWRDKHDFDAHDRLPHRPRTLADEQARLSHLFNNYAARIPKEQKQALKKLEQHIQQRLKDMAAALPAMTGITVQIRASGTRRAGMHRCHVDGHSLGAPVRVLRILEPVDSDGTLVYDNRDFDIEQKKKSTMVAGYGWLRGWDVLNVKRPAEDMPAYMAPANSLLVISNDAHPWKPVLHNEPPAREGHAPSLRRLLICYDISLPRDWHRGPRP
jgi:hypothetical protein